MAGKALKAYEEQYKKVPKDAQTLMAYSKKTLKKEITASDANKVIKARKDKDNKGKDKESKSKGKDKEKEKEKATDSKKEKEPKKEEKKKKEKIEYNVGDELLLSKDRMGTLKYAGEIPELGEGIWYGVELTDGSVGQTDGMVKGKRYFQCDGKRALFVPVAKIRRVMNRRDHTRQGSLIDARQRAQSSAGGSSGNGTVANAAATATSEVKKEESSEAAAAPSKAPAQAAETETKEAEPAASENKSESREKTASDASAKTVEEVMTASEDGSQQGAGASAGGASTGSIRPSTSALQNVLEFILDQPSTTRDQLLDVYTNPSLSPLLCAAFAQVKALDASKQSEVWDQLLQRWRRYLR